MIPPLKPKPLDPGRTRLRSVIVAAGIPQPRPHVLKLLEDLYRGLLNAAPTPRLYETRSLSVNLKHEVLP